MKPEDFARLSRMIKRHEGLRLRPYKCSADKLTIGYGRNLEDIGITEHEAEYLLGNDINRAAAQASEFRWFAGLNPPRQAAIIDMVFNLGIRRFKGFVKAIAALEQWDYENAADEILDSRYATQTGRRAVKIATVIRLGEW